MLILGIESATPVASAALADEEGLLGEVLLNVGLTHSEQLLPMIDDLLHQCKRTVRDVTAIGVSAGPGSFTGLRIGMATAKALAQGLSAVSAAAAGEKVPLLAVPTLEAMAWRLLGQEVVVSPMLNARRSQIYTGLYRWRHHHAEVFAARQRGKKDRMPAGACGDGWRLDCLIPPEAVSPEDWAKRLDETEYDMYLLGDGAAMYEEIWRKVPRGRAAILPPVAGLCRGGYIALAAGRRIREAGARTMQDAQEFYGMKPVYLRGI